MMNFANLRIVLVGTTHPGNIGASARAMKNMGLEQLVLVNPARYPHAEATARASGADDILANARVVGSLDQALNGCSLVLGASARRRNLAWPELDPRQSAARAAAVSGRGQVALVFGRERSGLTNAELDSCHFLVHIPANPDYSSLNLAAAVQVLSYELRMASVHPPVTRDVEANGGQLPAPAEEMRRFYQHLEQVLIGIGFLDPTNPRHLMRRMHRLFNRARLDSSEVNILRGVLSAVQRPRRRANDGSR
jgi:tRNA/rRNA methyltransferase/tRNA (cytidine32/uridine32-2'-O)-methyltransferase